MSTTRRPWTNRCNRGPKRSKGA